MGVDLCIPDPFVTAVLHFLYQSRWNNPILVWRFDQMTKDPGFGKVNHKHPQIFLIETKDLIN